jgi:hypothetical protein
VNQEHFATTGQHLHPRIFLLQVQCTALLVVMTAFLLGARVVSVPVDTGSISVMVDAVVAAVLNAMATITLAAWYYNNCLRCRA